jgi:hypothetical protein
MRKYKPKVSESKTLRTFRGMGGYCRFQANLTPPYNSSMCRNIKNLFNFDPPVTDQEVRNASLQFVRKISGFNKPSKANEASFNLAIDEITASAARLLHSLETNAEPKNREEEAAKAKARSAERFGTA